MPVPSRSCCREGNSVPGSDMVADAWIFHRRAWWEAESTKLPHVASGQVVGSRPLGALMSELRLRRYPPITSANCSEIPKSVRTFPLHVFHSQSAFLSYATHELRIPPRSISGMPWEFAWPWRIVAANSLSQSWCPIAVAPREAAHSIAVVVRPQAARVGLWVPFIRATPIDTIITSCQPVFIQISSLYCLH